MLDHQQKAGSPDIPENLKQNIWDHHIGPFLDHHSKPNFLTELQHWRGPPKVIRMIKFGKRRCSQFSRFKNRCSEGGDRWCQSQWSTGKHTYIPVLCQKLVQRGGFGTFQWNSFMSCLRCHVSDWWNNLCLDSLTTDFASNVKNPVVDTGSIWYSCAIDPVTFDWFSSWKSRYHVFVVDFWLERMVIGHSDNQKTIFCE